MKQVNFIVLHGTASPNASAVNIGNDFRNSSRQAGTHFIIDKDGSLVQCAPLLMPGYAMWSAGATTTHKPYIPVRNHNYDIISIEHCKYDAVRNSDVLTAPQQETSFALVDLLTRHFNLVRKYGDDGGSIVFHSDIDGVNRSFCPGPYPIKELVAFLANQPMEVEMIIDLNNKEVQNYFSAALGGVWVCKQTLKQLKGGILAKYVAYGNSDLCGLTFLGLPKTNEVPLDTAGNVFQVFERGILVYDPLSKYDSPAGHTGSVYAAHVDTNMNLAILENEKVIAALNGKLLASTESNTLLQKEKDDLQKSFSTEIAGINAKLSDAEKALADATANASTTATDEALKAVTLVHAIQSLISDAQIAGGK